MIIFRNKFQQVIIVILLLLSLIWTGFNLVYFTHSHIDENGKIVIHAHPYQRENQKNTNSPKHPHSKRELIILAFIYQVLSHFTCILFFIFFLLNFNTNVVNKFSFQWNPAKFFCKNIFRRGPPSFIQFI